MKISTTIPSSTTLMEKQANSSIIEASQGSLSIEPSQSQAYHKNEDGDAIMSNGLKAGISGHSVNLIAIAGIIGPGVVMGFASLLKASGPVGMLIGFTIVSLLVVPVLFYIGEMNSMYDLNFAGLGSKFVSRGFGATIALTYVVLWVTNIIAEYTSLTAALQIYTDKIPTYGWYLIMWTFFTAFQTLNVSWWAETEFWLAIIKLIFLTGFYLFSIIYAAGGIKGHSPGNPFRDYPLHSGFKGVVNGLVFAGTFMSGVESVSVIATETKNIKKAIPSAVKNTLIRILYVYYGLTIAYGITVPYNNEILSSGDKVLRSPMLIAFQEAGWKNAGYFVTTMILIICMSSINTAIYLASRSLFSWSEAGYGPKIFTKTTKRGVPWVAIHFCHLFGFLSIMSYSQGSSVAYGYIVNVTGVAAFAIWTTISITHLQFRKNWLRSGRTLDELVFVSWFYPWTNYFTITLGSVLVLVQGWSVFKPFSYKDFIDAYILIPVFFISWLIYDMLYFKEGFVKAHEIDFDQGRRPDLDDYIEEHDKLS